MCPRLPIGFALLAASALDPLVVPSSVGIHAWTAGAFGLMPLAVMTRATLVGGRVVPSFTRNWLARQEKRRLPAPFSRFDVASIAVSLVSLLLWVGLPDGAITGVALIAAAVIQGFRLARWAGDRTASDRLVLVLHVGYAFVISIITAAISIRML